MNPFDLTGPPFLLFYLVVSGFVIGALILIHNVSEFAYAPKIDLADPYLIAYLRGGKDEALRVALVSLIDRGLLVVNGTKVTCAEKASPDSVRQKIEKAVMKRYAKPGFADAIINDPSFEKVFEPYDETLKRNLLLPDDSVNRARRLYFVAAVIVLIAIAGTKAYVALQRGRTNIAFLIILMVIAILIAAKVSFPRLTARGTAMLKDVQTLYAGLKDRAATIRPGGATIEPMLLAAVFGIGALAGDAFAYTNTLFAHPTLLAGGSSKKSSWSVSWESASCGSGGGSCGSSCGGGGCGGGCGGCGG